MPPVTADPPPTTTRTPHAEVVPATDTAPPPRPVPTPGGPGVGVTATLLGVPLAAWLVLVVLSGTTSLLLPGPAEEEDPQVAAAVVIAPVEGGRLVRSRGFSGTLESPAVLEASPLVSGRVAAVEVRLGDVVERGQTLVRLDPDELEQAVVTAEAALAVAEANEAEAVAAEAIADRTVQRVRQLADDGLTSDAEADSAEAERLGAAAAVQVAEAQRLSAEAGLRTARIRRSRATVAAVFTGGSDTRAVAEVSVQEGDAVSPGDTLVRLVQLDPLRAVFAATQADLAGLSVGQRVDLTTDAAPGRTFVGRVDRLAPSFSTTSRQARVEVDVANPDRRLLPGAFVRLDTDLETLDDARSIPRDAVVSRDGDDVVFAVDADARTVRRVEVELGMVAGTRVQLLAPPLDGDVVVLGQQLVKDGARINATRNRGEAVLPEVLPDEEDAAP